MQGKEQRKHEADLAFGVVEAVRMSNPYRLDLHELDWAVDGVLQEQVEDEQISQEEATVIYSAFQRIFLHNGQID